MRVAAERGALEVYGAEQLGGSLACRRTREAGVQVEGLHELVADATYWVQTAHRTLRDHRDLAGPDPPPRALGPVGELGLQDGGGASDRAAHRKEAEQDLGDRRFARP